MGYDPDAAPDRVAVAMGNGVAMIPRIHLNRLSTLGRQQLGFPVLAHSLPPSAGVDGLLGLDFLRGSVLTVDFRVGQLDLFWP